MIASQNTPLLLSNMTTTAGQAVSEMEQGLNKKALEAPGAAKVMFPTPKYTFTIYAPTVILLNEQSPKQQKLVENQWKDFTFNTTKSVSKKKVRVKIAALLVKMLNRLIREQILPREAIQCMASDQFVFVQILMAPSALPIILQRCERIGVGNVVGVCFATPVETTAVPPPGPNQEFHLNQAMNLASATTATTSSSNSNALEQDCEETTTTARLSDHGNDDADDISDEDEDDGDSNTESLPASSVLVPFLSEDRKKELAKMIVKARKEWLLTASRIRVEQVAEEVAANAAFTWDYAAFVFCAATVAAIGLGTNSGATTIASMLISPIMGPCMGFTFGTTIRNQKLILTSFRNEVMSLVICIVVGLFWGMIAAVTNTPEERNWPSTEMINRGDPLGISSGILIALPSGMATALSTLGKNSSGMVGVAISLSLLPPAVNAGMCWMYAALLNTDIGTRNEGDDTDYVETGLISFGLTLVNILCIWLAGVFTFGLKEVAPIAHKNAFWARDIQNYRAQLGEEQEGMIDTEVINEGIQAALELQQDAGKDVYEGDFAFELDRSMVGAARRQGLAANAWEDALFVDGNFGMDAKAVVGGAMDDVLPDETTLENMERRQSVAASLLLHARPFGGLGEAGEALFDDRLVAGIAETENMTLPSDADGVVHANVAKKILLEKFD